MTQEQFNRERDFGAALAIAKQLHAAGLITEKEYAKLSTIFAQKYRPIIGGLHLQNP